jgi:protein tyrosine/serine phosphatase
MPSEHFPQLRDLHSGSQGASARTRDEAMRVRAGWRNSRAAKVLRSIGIAVLAVVLTIGAYAGIMQLTGNFHPVIAATLYRSAQPSAAEIRRYHAVYGIRTIVNLRGEHDRASWYEAEATEAKRLGITLVNFEMSAGQQLTQDRAAKLVAILKHAEKPILIHCKGGADRSGLASALYLAAVAKQGEQAAESQISIRYGHISLPFAPAYAMDLTFEALEPWLGFPHS